MKSKGLRRRVEGQFFDIVDVLVDGGALGLPVDAGLRELMTDIEGLFVEVDLYDGCDESHVLVVGDPSSVVDLRSQKV